MGGENLGSQTILALYMYIHITGSSRHHVYSWHAPGDTLQQDWCVPMSTEENFYYMPFKTNFRVIVVNIQVSEKSKIITAVEALQLPFRSFLSCEPCHEKTGFSHRRKQMR